MRDEILLHNLPEPDLPPADELPGDLRDVADVVGVRLTLALVDRFRGTYVRFHNLDKIKRSWRDRSIRAEADRRIQAGEDTGKIYADLARRWGVSDRTIWNIAGSGDETEDARQIGLFKTGTGGRG
jgi:hypothetical protein